MANVNYATLTNLSPVVLNYQYYRNEALASTTNSYKNGYYTYNIQGLTNFQDVTINRSSCFVLTSTVSLSSIFNTSATNNIGVIPVSVLLQPRSALNSTQYVTYNSSNNTFALSQQSGTSIVHISPVPNTNQVELFIDNKYLQVSSSYPYNIIVSSKTLNANSIYRQRFYVISQNNTIQFYTLTDTGYRFLSLNSQDFNLRATGLVLGNSVYSESVFIYTPVTTTSINPGFIPNNDWVTYFYDIETGTENKTLSVNKEFTGLATNLLLDFPIEPATEKGSITVNIANLKTNLTPTGGPAPVDNTYIKQVITTN
jgi:hypothetical protein